MEAISPVEFLQRLQRLLDQGDFVATYKLALLRALADLAVESRVGSSEPLEINIGSIAERFIEYYWRQARPYRTGVLRQNSGLQAAVLTAILEQGAESLPLRVVRADLSRWRALVKAVAANVERYPLRRLQNLRGEGADEFLYPAPAGPFLGARAVTASIWLKPGVAAALRSFHYLVMQLVEARWIRQLGAIDANRDQLADAADLPEFLFGADRASLADFTRVLVQISGGECFYCRGPVQAAVQLDHFIPWSQYAVDLGHNFVVACGPCNARKSSYLPGMTLLARWSNRNLQSGQYLAAALARSGLPHDVGRTYRVAEWAYEGAARVGATLWDGPAGLTQAGPAWREALGPMPAWALAAEPPPV